MNIEGNLNLSSLLFRAKIVAINNKKSWTKREFTIGSFENLVSKSSNAIIKSTNIATSIGVSFLKIFNLFKFTLRLYVLLFEKDSLLFNEVFSNKLFYRFLRVYQPKFKPGLYKIRLERYQSSVFS